jgi:hypothetical protein
MVAHAKSSLTSTHHVHWSRLPAQVAPIVGFLLLAAGVIILPIVALTLAYAWSQGRSADASALLPSAFWSGGLGLVLIFAGVSILRWKKPEDVK